jgi:transcription elongation factor GreA
LAAQTKNGAVKGTNTTQTEPLSGLLKLYVRKLDQDAKQKAQPEIAKFIRWVGGERAASSLSPAEVGEYSDTFGARATTAEAAERLGAVKDFLTYIRKEGHSEVNLSLHLRLRKGRTTSGKGGSLAGRTQAIRLTRAGYNDLTKRLSQLQEERVRLAGEIHRAAADKDVRENAPLEAARENQGMVVARIREIETTLKQAVVLDDSGDDRGRVRIGSKVTLKEKASDKSMSYQLVEPNEANPLNGKISVVSPVGAAILGRAAGDQVNVKTPSGPHVYIIERTS